MICISFYVDAQSILMYHYVLKVQKNCGLEFSKLSYKVASAYILPQNSNICLQKIY